jgi:hypothetical protein
VGGGGLVSCTVTKLFQLDENTLKMLNCERILNTSNGFAMARDYVKKRIRKCLISF